MTVLEYLTLGIKVVGIDNQWTRVSRGKARDLRIEVARKRQIECFNNNHFFHEYELSLN